MVQHLEITIVLFQEDLHHSIAHRCPNAGSLGKRDCPCTVAQCFVYVCVCVCVCVCMQACVLKHEYVYVCTCLHKCVCICVEMCFEHVCA